MKLVTNQLWFIHAAALGEGFALGMANGVELDTLWRAIRESVADSFVAHHDAPSIFAGHYDPSFPLDSAGGSRETERRRNTQSAAPGDHS